MLFRSGVAEAVQRSYAWIASPGESQASGAAHANQLVINQIRRHADQAKIAPLLANDFVSCGGRNQMSKAFERNRIAVMDQFGNSFAQGDNFCGFRMGQRGETPGTSYYIALAWLGYVFGGITQEA